MSPVDRPLCIAATCAARGYHAPDCVGECAGCLPRLAADGIYLCRGHLEGLGRDITEAARLRAVLAGRLTGGGEAGTRISGTPNRGLNLNERAAEVRTLIRHRLVSWSLLIADERGFSLPTRQRPEVLPDGFVGPPRLVTETDDTDKALGAFVALSAAWLAAKRFAPDAVAEFRELVTLAYPIAYPTGAKVFEVGPCIADGCEGIIKAIVRRIDSLLPSAIVCDVDEAHAWPADQWLTLGRKLKQAA